MHTHYEGILAHFKVKIHGKYYCQFFIWDTGENMHKSVETSSDTSIGHCHAVSWVENYKNGEYRSGKKFAEIHLLKVPIGSGLVAHEIMHCVGYFIRFRDWNMRLKEVDERVATIAENLTKNFWINYFKIFKD